MGCNGIAAGQRGLLFMCSAPSAVSLPPAMPVWRLPSLIFPQGLTANFFVTPMPKNFEVSVAPMLKVSTPEYRHFMRIVSPRSKVFTEMIVDTSLLHMSSDALAKKLGLPTDRCILQLGGGDPELVARGAQRAQALGYTQFNLNCGCPSDRVQSGRFGAVLMKEPLVIAAIVQRVYEQTGTVMSVKCRIGVDDIEDYNAFRELVTTIVAHSPCRTFYVHARKCLLKGLSPANNRRVPPLRYDFVFRLKEEFPELTVILNGGLREIDQVLAVRDKVDGVMLGRKPMEDPMFFSELEHRLFGTPLLSALDAIQIYLSQLSAAQQGAAKDQFRRLDAAFFGAGSEPTPLLPHAPATEYRCHYLDLKPIEGILFGQRGCKAYKRRLAELVREGLPPAEVASQIAAFLSPPRAQPLPLAPPSPAAGRKL